MIALRNLYRTLTVLAILLVQACVEPIEFESETFEDLLVIEATITGELSYQEVSLARTFPLEEEEAPAFTGARVSVIEDSQVEYAFEEINAGHYRSADMFRAVPGREYQLRIITGDGILYQSDAVELEMSSGLDNLYPRRSTLRDSDGVALQIDNFNSAEASSFYKYEYEETYKIISRYSSWQDLEYINGEFVVVPKTKEETTCYNTRESQEIILASTTSLSDNNLEGFLVKFIARENPIMSRRYSILVKQYAISREAHTYYTTMRELAGSENVFAQNQPGYIESNVFSPDNPELKVLGFFNVSSVSSERIFFDFTDFFPPEDRPYFTDDCNPANPSLFPLPDNLVALLDLGVVKYLGRVAPDSGDGGPYRVVEAECVDCTLLGTNVVPEFWEE